jgi:hypothetical protein
MLTKEEMEDRLDSLSFKAPKTIAQMKAWHHFATYEKPIVNIYEVFELMDLPFKKIESFKNKLVTGLTKKENLEYLSYLGCHSFDIRSILSYFRV